MVENTNLHSTTGISREELVFMGRSVPHLGRVGLHVRQV